MGRREARDRRHSRVRKKVHGTAARPRLAVYKSNRYIYAQIIDDEGGRTLAAASSQEKSLRNKTLSIESAAEVGKLLADRAGDADIAEVVFDRGGYPFHGRVKALADAVREAGVKF
ncbi:MAG: 50S ribosomal protein L18 [Acidimicrobiia bacterium]|nr:50S ribosomal protein L18 [Acidimicrobiia bacterium]MBT8194233.1 50S ribosomal protein L18 [Acidimicrobiia bacterium]MBT8247013.1 50S ribosomal protein L18 [Acidimicrobiia bacterium]NNF88137.1 50S ribosomal protein L18 [Acidimicrobiia bacterium]NNJ47385.1 50S ribosomal protein L18 [Acidimicrobiia bacterium]